MSSPRAMTTWFPEGCTAIATGQSTLMSATQSASDRMPSCREARKALLLVGGKLFYPPVAQDALPISRKMG